MAKEKRVGVILSGSGYLDGVGDPGGHPHPALPRQARAPRSPPWRPTSAQMHVVDHVKGEPAPGERAQRARTRRPASPAAPSST